jgi:mono/diheme cytochrome c family protein
MQIASARHAALAMFVAIAVTPIVAAGAEPDGAALYQANCAKCHGADGKAGTFVGMLTGAPSLLQSAAARGDASALPDRIRSIGKHEHVVSKLSPAELSAIAGAVHDMATTANP